MKILLILPFNVYGGRYDNDVILNRGGEAEIPLGLCYIKSYVKSKIAGIDILVHDANIDAIDYIINHDNNADMNTLWKRLGAKIRDYNPDIVGVSVFSHAVAEEGHRITELCKKFNKNIITVMGGSYPTLSHDTAMEDVNLDVIVSSEGEVVFYNLVKALMDKKPLDGVKGIIYRHKSKIIANPPEEKIKDLDSLPYPDLDDLPINLYNELSKSLFERIDTGLKSITVISARGCIYNCGFCATKKVWGNVRERNPKNLVDEIKYLKKRYNINTVKFNDDFTMKNHQRVIGICDLLMKEKVVDRWYTCGLNVHSLLNTELIDKMIESGYKYFLLSIESGSEKILKMIRKPVRLENVKKAVENLRRHKDIYIMGGFIVGFPFETKEDIQKTFELAQSLDLNWAAFNIFSPFPKTYLYDYCLEKGYLNPKKITYTDCQNTNVLSTPNFDKDWLLRERYLKNLKINFVNNYWIKKEDYSEAIRQLNYILKMDPNHAFALFFIGYSYKKKGDIKNAEKYFNMAKEIFEKDKGWCDYYLELREEIEARTNMRDFIEGRLCKNHSFPLSSQASTV